MIWNMVAAFLIACLAGLGVGSGGLFVFYLIATGMGQFEAQGINLIFYICCASAAFFVHIRTRKINLKVLLMLMLSGALGAYLGALSTDIAGAAWVRRIFGGVLLLSGILSFFEIGSAKKRKKNQKSSLQ